MRIIKTFGIFFLCCIVLTACNNGGKKLFCFISLEEEGLINEQTIEITFKKDSLNKITQTAKYTAYSVEAADSIMSSMSYFEEIYKSVGFDASVKQNDEVITITVSGTVDSIKKAFDENDGESILDFDIDDDYEDIKEELEEDGYTCE